MEKLLSIYLNDHLAGSTSGIELARRLARQQAESRLGEPLGAVAKEIAEDRDDLLEMMHALDITPRRAKVYAGWAAEKAGRLKLNGRVMNRSPLSFVLELETLMLGVEGKQALWRTLRTLAEHEPRLDDERLARLEERAQRQHDALEELRSRSAGRILTTH
ncbi:hypothetical protein GCM10009716_19170 [Streptomyces sodiiphilus]|uniref:Uncharacterized protein n=1 Tax=Streptomyces sodiiphilus TaxID=226217 RepID=A0ABN2P123_9ACTN